MINNTTFLTGMPLDDTLDAEREKLMAYHTRIKNIALSKVQDEYKRT